MIFSGFPGVLSFFQVFQVENLVINKETDSVTDSDSDFCPVQIGSKDPSPIL